MGKYKWPIFWILAAFLMFFMNGSCLITDTVESNYALSAREMLERGDWVSPHIHGNPWFDKPILYIWLMARAFQVFGVNEFAARLVPAVFGLLGLGLVIWGTRKIYGEKADFLSGVILLTTVQYYLIAKSVITDQVLFFFFSGTLLFFYLAYSGDNKKYYYGVYVCSAFATLTKGPIGFLLPGLIIVLFLIFDKGWRELKNAKLLSGTLLFLAIGAPWYYSMYQMHGMNFFNSFIGAHNFLRATVSEHPRDNVIWYYTAVNFAAFFPWSIIALKATWHAIRPAGKFVLPPAREKFLIIWAFTIFFFYQNMATKYITYTFPMLFPLAVLAAGYLSERWENFNMRSTILLEVGFYGILTAAGIYLLKWGQDVQIDFSIQGIVITVTGLFLISLFLLHNYRKDKAMEKAFIAVALIAFTFNVMGAVTVCRELMENKSMKLEANFIKKHIPTERFLCSYGNYRTSAVFYSGRKIVKIINPKYENEFKPSASSWTVTNVMPYETWDKTAKRDKLAVLLREKDMKELKAIIPGRQWQLVKGHAGYVIALNK